MAGHHVVLSRESAERSFLRLFLRQFAGLLLRRGVDTLGQYIDSKSSGANSSCTVLKTFVASKFYVNLCPELRSKLG